MNTFNKMKVATKKVDFTKALKPQMDWSENASVSDQLDAIGSLGIVFPAMNRADAKRVNKLTKMGTIKTLKYAIARSEFTTSERLDTLMDLLARLDKLNAGVLDGGAKLKAELIETVWLVYAKVESQGVANDHYMETGIPCNDYGTLNFGHDGQRKVLVFDCISNAKRGPQTLVDSKLEPEQQWAALELAELFGSPKQIAQPPALDYGQRSECTEHGQPIGRTAPEFWTDCRDDLADPNAGLGGVAMTLESEAEIRELLGQRTIDQERFDADQQVQDRAETIDTLRGWCDVS